MFATLTHRRKPQPEPLPELTFDRRGYYRSPITLSSYRKGKPAPNKGMRFPIEVLTREEVNALIEACGRGPAGWRNRAMITMMAGAGLRVSEVLALYPKDVDLERGRVTVLRGKGGKRRVVALDPGACAIVSQWARVRAGLGISSRRPLFCVITEPTKGEAVSAIYVRNLLKKLAPRAGIAKRVHPHGLRHTYASQLVDRRVPLTAIQAMLGHSDLRVTQVYIHQLNPEAELELIRSLDWGWTDQGLPAPTVSGAQSASPLPARQD